MGRDFPMARTAVVILVVVKRVATMAGIQTMILSLARIFDARGGVVLRASSPRKSAGAFVSPASLHRRSGPSPEGAC